MLIWLFGGVRLAFLFPHSRNEKRGNNCSNGTAVVAGCGAEIKTGSWGTFTLASQIVAHEGTRCLLGVYAVFAHYLLIRVRALTGAYADMDICLAEGSVGISDLKFSSLVLLLFSRTVDAAQPHKVCRTLEPAAGAEDEAGWILREQL